VRLNKNRFSKNFIIYIQYMTTVGTATITYVLDNQTVNDNADIIVTLSSMSTTQYLTFVVSTFDNNFPNIPFTNTWQTNSPLNQEWPGIYLTCYTTIKSSSTSKPVYLDKAKFQNCLLYFNISTNPQTPTINNISFTINSNASVSSGPITLTLAEGTYSLPSFGTTPDISTADLTYNGVNLAITEIQFQQNNTRIPTTTVFSQPALTAGTNAATVTTSFLRGLDPSKSTITDEEASDIAKSVGLAVSHSVSSTDWAIDTLQKTTNAFLGGSKK